MFSFKLMERTCLVACTVRLREEHVSVKATIKYQTLYWKLEKLWDSLKWDPVLLDVFILRFTTCVKNFCCTWIITVHVSIVINVKLNQEFSFLCSFSVYLVSDLMTFFFCKHCHASVRSDYYTALRLAGKANHISAIAEL